MDVIPKHEVSHTSFLCEDLVLGHPEAQKCRGCAASAFLRLLRRLNRYDFYKKLGFGEANCPNADLFFDNMISFPFHHWMSDEDFEYMLEATKEVLYSIKN